MKHLICWLIGHRPCFCSCEGSLHCSRCGMVQIFSTTTIGESL